MPMRKEVFEELGSIVGNENLCVDTSELYLYSMDSESLNALGLLPPAIRFRLHPTEMSSKHN